MNECYLYLLIYRWHTLDVWGELWTPEDMSVTVTGWITAVSDTLEGVLHATSGYDADPASLEHTVTARVGTQNIFSFSCSDTEYITYNQICP